MAAMLDDAAIVARSGGPLTAEVEGETVMFDPSKGKYFSLAGVGGRIWDLLEQPRSVADVCHAVSAEFEIDASECQPEVVAFLDDLREAGLVEVRG
jgi:PqqD family protein of HPr-rel-A system